MASTDPSLHVDAPAVAALFAQRLSDQRILVESFNGLMSQAVALRCFGAGVMLSALLSATFLIWHLLPLEWLLVVFTTLGWSPNAGVHGGDAGGSVFFSLVGFVAVQLAAALSRFLVLKVHTPRFCWLVEAGRLVLIPSKVAFHMVQVLVGLGVVWLALRVRGDGGLMGLGCGGTAALTAYPRVCLNTNTACVVVSAIVASLSCSCRCLTQVRV